MDDKMKIKRIIFSLLVLSIVLIYPTIYIGQSIIEIRDKDKYIKLGFVVENNTLYNLKIIEKKIDRKADAFQIFQKITEEPKIAEIQEAIDRGYIVLIALEPWNGYVIDGNYTKYEPLAITNGSIDEDIARWDRAFKSLKYKKGDLVIRVGHEVNGDWYPWGAFWKNNTMESSTEEYRYIISRLRDERLLRLWSLNRKTFGYEGEWQPYEKFYPGDKYVDIIGISSYNRKEDQWMNFSYLYGTIYKDVSRFNKPIWIAEMSSISIGGDKAEWIRDSFDQIRNNYTKIEAVFWFNENKIFQGELKDWQFDSTDASGITFREVVKKENMKRI